MEAGKVGLVGTLWVQRSSSFRANEVEIVSRIVLLSFPLPLLGWSMTCAIICHLDALPCYTIIEKGLMKKPSVQSKFLASRRSQVIPGYLYPKVPQWDQVL